MDVPCLGRARPVDGEITDARPGFFASMAGVGLRRGCGRLRHDQRYVVVHARAPEPVVATDFQRQPGLAGRCAKHHAVTPAVAVAGRVTIPGRFTVPGFRVAFGRRERVGWPAGATELATARAIHAVG